MRAYGELVGALLRSNLREPIGFFFTLVFAPVLVVLFGLIFGNDPSPDFGGQGYVTKTLPAYGSIVLAIVGVMTMPQALLTLRASGALRRLQLTPLGRGTFIAADLTVHFVLGLVGILLAVVTGVVGFGVPLPTHLPVVMVAFALGMLAFLALGYVLAALYPSMAAAAGLGNILMIVLMMTSGAFLQMEMLPPFMQKVMQASPIRHFVDLVTALWQGEAWSTQWVATAVLVGMVAVFGPLGVWLFRWDQRA
ncbi:MAG: ABC transporter permease [Nocardioides sp.]|uniref:ABC transporter permease n=1 Tax=Nocardioides sp. TaxID=35761 RepID=UPI003F0EAEFE